MARREHSRTGSKARKKRLEIYPEDEVAGFFVAKIEASFPAFDRELLVHRYDTYTIDYTGFLWRPRSGNTTFAQGILPPLHRSLDIQDIRSQHIQQSCLEPLGRRKNLRIRRLPSRPLTTPIYRTNTCALPSYPQTCRSTDALISRLPYTPAVEGTFDQYRYRGCPRSFGPCLEGRRRPKLCPAAQQKLGKPPLPRPAWSTAPKSRYLPLSMHTQKRAGSRVFGSGQPRAVATTQDGSTYVQD